MKVDGVGSAKASNINKPIMLQEQGKYIYTLHKKAGGLDSKIRDLVSLIHVALAMKRIPIIMEEISCRTHQLDNKEPKIIDWERYIDLAKTKIFKTESSGTIKELPDTLQYVYEKDFDFGFYHKNQIRFIEEKQIYEMENEKYPIVCMLNSGYTEHALKKESLEFQKFLRAAALRARFVSPYLIILLPSEIVNNLTDVVLNYFGTSQASMEVLSSTLYSLSRIRYADSAFDYIDLNCYACMHVRYGIHWRYASKLIKKSTRLRKELEKVVKMVYERNYKNLPLYIMSNIMEADYFDFLKPQYDIYRYTDFKELKEQSSSDGEIDHNFLYSVEKNIMKHAVVKIFSKSRNNFVFEYA